MKENDFEILLRHEGIEYQAMVTPLQVKDKIFYRVRLIDHIHLPFIEITVHRSAVPVDGADAFWIQQEEENRGRMKNHDFIQAVGVAITKGTAADI